MGVWVSDCDLNDYDTAYFKYWENSKSKVYAKFNWLRNVIFYNNVLPELQTIKVIFGY